ncbi:UDP-glucose/GDP-mannose dehydrogenase family protein [Thalassolituus sp.]|uniref:UDP-glucose dehydrogenase family protein n=1 Tax=Thalassolituus sp. TaxID=2030822 RepID=UPI003518E638
MKVSVAGAGYAALVNSACFAEMGNLITHFSFEPTDISGGLPFYEPGLLGMLESNAKAGRLLFTTDADVALADADILILAFSEKEKVSAADIATTIGRTITRPVVIVNRLACQIGTTEEICRIVNHEVAERGLSFEVDVVANPEFLKEGMAIEDFMRPDRIVLGVAGHNARAAMSELFKPFSRQHDRLMFMGIRDAELARYATSAMLATRVSLMNEISALAETCGADMENVRRGIGSDQRIGYAYLYPGVGYGGVGLPRDVSTLIEAGQQAGVDMVLLSAVAERNRRQGDWALKQLSRELGNLEGRKIAIWGLAFRPETDDVAASPSIVLIRQLLAAGAVVSAYDPLAMTNARLELGDDAERVVFAGHQYDALPDADALVLMTECKPFRQPDFNAMAKLMKRPFIVDGRNQYDGESLQRGGFIYRGVGRSPE